MVMKKNTEALEAILKEEKKNPPKRIICITQYEDETVHFSYSGLKGRAEAMNLLRRCDLDVRRKLNRGTPLSPPETQKESA